MIRHAELIQHKRDRATVAADELAELVLAGARVPECQVTVIAA